MAGVRPAAPRYGFSNKPVALRPSSEKLPGSPIFHFVEAEAWLSSCGQELGGDKLWDGLSGGQVRS